MKRVLQKLFVLACLFCINRLYAQPLVPSQFVNYNTSKGLSHNSVTGIAQDETGYMWISTWSGINRFNGSQFVQYHSTSDSISLGADNIKGIQWLNKDELAIYGTGVYIINTKTGNARNIFIPYYRKQFQYKFNMIEKVKGDQNDNVYVLTRSGFYHFDKDHKLLSRFDYYTEEQVPVAHFVFAGELLDLDKDRLLIVSSGGLYLYDKRVQKVRKMQASDCPVLEEFRDHRVRSHVLIQVRPGRFLILKTATDTVYYVNIAEGRKVVSKLPFNPLWHELSYYSKLLALNDTSYFITGQESGFYKLNLNSETGKVTILPEKYFASYTCNSLFLARNGTLWVGTNRGLFRSDDALKQVKIGRFPSLMEDSLPNMLMNEIYAARDKLYVGIRNPGNILIYNKENLKYEGIISLNEQRRKLDRSLSVYTMLEADSSTLLIGTNGPLFLADKNNRKPPQPLWPPRWNRLGHWCGELFKDSKGTIWISSSTVYNYDPRQKTFSMIPDEVQLSSQIIGPEVIREDGAGNIWMAGHGLSRYNTEKQKFDLRLDSFPFIKMPDKQVNSMLIDKQRNNIWFNSSNNGLILYEINTGKYRHFTKSDGLPDNNVSSLALVGKKLWVACFSGIACIDFNDYKITGFGKEDGFPDMPIHSGANFFYDSASQQLYMPFAKTIVGFRPEELLQKKSAPRVFIEDLAISDRVRIFLPSNTINTSWKDNEIRITIGAINFSDPTSQRFAYRIKKEENTPWTELGSQPSFSISSLSPGTHNIQVKVYSLTSRWPEQVKELSLVVSPPFWLTSWFILVMGVLMLGLIYLLVRWTNNVARKKEMEKTHIEKLKADDYKNQFELEQISNYFSSTLAGKKTKDEVLWDVAANLIGRMKYEDCIIYLWNKDKTKMLQKAAFGPKGKPELISASGFEVAPGQGIVGHVIQTRQPLLVNDTRLDSRYRVDDQFRCSEIAVPIIHNDELLGVIDSENSEPGYFNERDIKVLTTLATLIGNKLKQIESEQSLEAKQRELAGINEQLAEARLSALQAQMNPHFVFNALNSIKRMILDGDNDKASRYMSKFALMIRMTLEHSKEIFVTLDENVEYLKAYLDMEKLRFDDTFAYSIHIDDNVDTTETVLPSMMIQPLVENAIWHGLMHAEADKKIRVSFSQTQNKITVTVEDNGIGIHHSEKLREKHRPLHRPVGLENLNKRIKIMNEKYDTDCTLEITDLRDNGKNGRGTRVVLQINLINA